MKKKKNDLSKLLEKYQPAVKKAGEQLSRAMKTAEEDISKMYKIAQAHIEMQMSKVQKEKVYHEIGKEVAQKMSGGQIDAAMLDKYKKRLEKLDASQKKAERSLSRAGGTKKKRTSRKRK